MLATSTDLVNLNNYIHRCFHYIAKLDLVGDYKGVSADGMISGDGEKIQFLKPISSKSEIEVLDRSRRS